MFERGIAAGELYWFNSSNGVSRCLFLDSVQTLSRASLGQRPSVTNNDAEIDMLSFLACIIIQQLEVMLD